MTSASTPSSGILADASLNLTATAVGTWDPAKADALIPTRVVGYNPASTSVQGSGVLIGTATANLEASAQTKGDDPATDYAIASIASALDSGVGTGALPTSGFITKGMDLSADDTTVGNASQILGQANVNTAAEASATQGLAIAWGASATTTGIDLDSTTLNSGADASIDALATSLVDVNASAVEGEASAILVDPLGGGAVYGLGTGLGIVNVGADASIRATANDTALAEASTVTSQGSGYDNITASFFEDPANPGFPLLFAAEAYINRPVVAGISLNQLSAGDDVNLEVSASSVQKAFATSVDFDIATPKGGSVARVEASGQTVGINNTTISTGGNTQKFVSSASNQSEAISRSIAGTSESNAVDRFVYGASPASITIGGNANEGLSFNANSVANAEAFSTDGFSKSTSGNHGGGLTAGLVSFSGPSASLSIGGDSGAIRAMAYNSSSSISTSVQPQSDLLGESSASSAVSGARTNGIDSISVTVGKDGQLIGSATSQIESLASIIGTSNDLLTASPATADANAETVGIRLNNNNEISIGSLGAVVGQAFLGAESRASNVNATAGVETIAKVSSSSFGIDMKDQNNIISIGKAGSVEGVSIAGIDALGNITPINIESKSVMGGAKSELGGSPDPQSIGIQGFFDGSNIVASKIIAGSLGGNINGKSIANIDMSAESINSLSQPVETAYDGFQGVGIVAIDLTAGQQGNNGINGESTLNFNARSTSVIGDTNVYGGTSINPILSGGILANLDLDNFLRPSASLSGSMKAKSHIINTALSQTVNGSASSNLVNNSLGMWNYDVDIIGTGSLVVSSQSHGNSRALTVTGSALS